MAGYALQFGDQSSARVFATCDSDSDAFKIFRERGYDVEVYTDPEPPLKSLIIGKVSSGIDGLITTLRDRIHAEVFEAGRGTLKVVAQYAVGFNNFKRVDAALSSATPSRFIAALSLKPALPTLDFSLLLRTRCGS